jgi:hypothetical protein
MAARTYVYCVVCACPWKEGEAQAYRTELVDAPSAESAQKRAAKSLSRYYKEFNGAGFKPSDFKVVGCCHVVPGGDIEVDI